MVCSCTMHPQWRFIATDIQSECVDAARANVPDSFVPARARPATLPAGFAPSSLQRSGVRRTARQVRANALSDRIDVRLCTVDAEPLDAAFGDAIGEADADFVMCNPPFFACAEV